jgi:hypothetical protein
MKEPSTNDPFDVLSKAYEAMYENAASSLHKLKDKDLPALHKILDQARDKAVKIDELTESDAAQLMQWLKRDLEHAFNYLAESGNEIKGWLGFETSKLENEFFYLLLQTADQTTVELQQFKENAQHPEYHTGEISGPGTLTCDECGEKLHFYKAGKIPPCPKCHGTVYHRSTSEL